ncbi:helix-turn-helix domain-containing protein, partial [Pyxidicoccus sp. 3LG]
DASFAALEDAVRRERAFQLLRDGQLAQFEIAFLLGFSDPSAFTRAFRRWSGRTPLAWQKENAPP